MSPLRQFVFAARLAYRQLVFERAKLLAAALGVMFACVLVFMQLGFRDALYASISVVPRALDGDVFIQHKQTEALWRSVPFARSEMLRALAHPGIASATSLFIGQAQWKNPQTRTKRTLLVWGSEPREAVFNLPGMEQYRTSLNLQDTALFDARSRPEFGPVAALLAQGPVVTEVNDRKIRVLGTVNLGASFAADGNLFTSDQNFLRLFPGRSADMVDVGVIRLRPGADPAAVRDALRARMSEDVHVFTLAELEAYEFAYWRNNAPVGFIFGFGVVMGLVVGMVIVYQILFTDITNHLNEFATLKAIGYSQRYLLMVVLASSLILAAIGFVPGFTLSLLLYKLAELVIYIPMPMPPGKIAGVFVMILVMCVIAGALAMRKMRSANPADMF